MYIIVFLSQQTYLVGAWLVLEIKLTTFASKMMIDDDDNDEKRGEN
jgi:hypothetical protein